MQGPNEPHVPVVTLTVLNLPVWHGEALLGRSRFSLVLLAPDPILVGCVGRRRSEPGREFNAAFSFKRKFAALITIAPEDIGSVQQLGSRSGMRELSLAHEEFRRYPLSNAVTQCGGPMIPVYTVRSSNACMQSLQYRRREFHGLGHFPVLLLNSQHMVGFPRFPS